LEEYPQISQIAPIQEKALLIELSLNRPTMDAPIMEKPYG
jgi:hypothetical protein